MKFAITRASDYNKKPCDKAYCGEYTPVDYRSFKSFEEYEKEIGESFLDVGTNHQVTDNGIQRDLDSKPCWCIDINSSEELMDFIAEYGDIIIGETVLTIYEDYVE